MNIYDGVNNLSFAKQHNIDSSEYREMLIEDCSFSVRVYNCLRRSNISTVEALLNLNVETLMHFRNLGRNSFEEIEAFIQKLAEEERSLLIGPVDSVEKGNLKNIFKLLSENAEKIVLGDFSFLEETELSEEENYYVSKYKDAFEMLGAELVFDAYSDKEKIFQIMEMFNSFIVESNKQKELLLLLERIPSDRKLNKAYGYINAFTTKDLERNKLKKICISEDSTISSMVTSFRFDDAETILLIKRFLKWCAFDLKKEINDLFEKLYANDRVQVVVSKRAQKKTLEEIGSELGVTRERVRQIEAKTKDKFSRYHRQIRVISKISAERNGDTVITPEEIEDYSGDKTQELIYLLKGFSSSNYIYDNQLGVFIVGDDSMQGRIQNILESLPDVVKFNELDTVLEMAEEEEIPADVMEKAFLDMYDIKGAVYCRSHLTLTAIYESILEKYYQSGIHIYDDDEIKLFKEKILLEYGNVKLPINDRAIAARITDIAILCGRGIYKPKQKSYIPKALLDKIHNYIVNNENPVFMTNTLFDVFEDELTKHGVDNKYFLQGILREYFEDEFTFRRDYISKDPNVTTVYSSIVNFIKNAEYSVSKEEVFSAFPGITEIVVALSLEDENVLNYFGEYLHANKISVYDDEKDYLHNAITEAMKGKSNIHIKDIYDSIVRYRPEIFARNGVAFSYSAFSFLNYLFRQDFQFSRPYIGVKESRIERVQERLNNFVYSNDEVSFASISEFTKDNHIMVQSWLEFYNSCNDKFLIANSKKLIKIEKTGITDEIAQMLEDYIVIDIDGTTPISDLKVWEKLPSINIPWTEWLIYSVINKWSEKLSVSTSSNVFKEAVPLIAPAGKMNVEAFKDLTPNKSNDEYRVDDLDNIDDLLEDIIDDMWEEI